jgi:hypothetical protein
MKRLMITSLVLLAGISGEVMAGCASNTQVKNKNNDPALTNLIAGQTVCASRSTTERWQEQHRGSGTSGALWDYKKGASDPVDPTKQVGTWSINLDDTVTYYYTGGPSYTYTVHSSTTGGNNPPYSFCTNGAEVVSGATFKLGESSCP